MDLRGLFGEVGTVTQVRLPVDRETGRPRGFAFVDVADKAQADAAVARFNQHMLAGRAMAVSEAVARDAAPPPRSFGGGGMGGGGGDVGRPSRPAEGRPAGGAPARNFGPDALPRNKRRTEGRNENAGPKGPIKERAAGRSGGGWASEDTDGDDDVPFWAVAVESDDED